MTIQREGGGDVKDGKVGSGAGIEENTRKDKEMRWRRKKTFFFSLTARKLGK